MVVVGVGAVAGVADAGVVVVPVAIAAVFLVVLAVIAVVVSCFVVRMYNRKLKGCATVSD